jgi:hypothetical protein
MGAKTTWVGLMVKTQSKVENAGWWSRRLHAAKVLPCLKVKNPRILGKIRSPQGTQRWDGMEWKSRILTDFNVKFFENPAVFRAEMEKFLARIERSNPKQSSAN